MRGLHRHFFATRSSGVKTPSRPRTPKPERFLRFQQLESRQLLAADSIADITGLWLTVGDREYFTSDKASVAVDVFAGETLQVTGIRYGLDESYTSDDGVIAFESYVRRDHGAIDTGSFDYTDGRFADPLDVAQIGGQQYVNPGNDRGWDVELIDNRVAVVAIRYFGDEFTIEDRMFVDVHVSNPPEAEAWIDTVTSVQGDWSTDETSESTASLQPLDSTGLVVFETLESPGPRFEIGVTATPLHANQLANGFVVLDYRSEDDFVYAGLRLEQNQWVIGHFDGEFQDLAVLQQEIAPRQSYDLRVAVEGSHVALAVDGVLRVDHDFGSTVALGKLGLANQRAFTQFSDFHLFDNSSLAEKVEHAQSLVEETAEAVENAIELESRVTEAHNEEVAHANMLAQERKEATQIAQTYEERHRELALLAEESEQEVAQSRGELGNATNELAKTERVYNDLQRVVDELEREILDLQASQDSLQTQFDALLERGQGFQQRSFGWSSSQTHRLSERAQDWLAEQSDRWRDALGARDSDGWLNRLSGAFGGFSGWSNWRFATPDSSETDRGASDLAMQLEEAKSTLLAARANYDQNASKLAELSEQIERMERSVDELQRELQLADELYSELKEELDAAGLKQTEWAEQAADLGRQFDLAMKRVSDSEHHRQTARENVENRGSQLQAFERRLAESLENLELAKDQDPGVDDASSHVYAVNFNRQHDGAFETLTGESHLVAGQLHLTSEDAFAISVLDDEALPKRTSTRMYATIHADRFDGYDENGFVVFDFQSPKDFKYAGARADTNQWVIGEVSDGQAHDLEIHEEAIGEGPAYDLQLLLDGATATLLVDGQPKIERTFADSIEDGRLGLASHQARTRFDQVAVMPWRSTEPDEGIDETPGDVGVIDRALAELFAD